MSIPTASKLHIRRLVFSAIFLAIALLLPFLTGQIPEVGNALCPMHLPVLICGFLCGWPWGMAVGFIAPLLRSLWFGMPPLLPIGVAMAFELAAYGASSGFLSRLFPKKIPFLYLSLILSMGFGRLVWGAVRFLIAGFQNTSFPFSLFWAGAFTNALPGIALQLLIVPAIVLALRKSGLNLNNRT